MEEKIITLRQPLDFAGTPVAEIRLREPVARELEEAGGSTVALISAIAKLPKSLIGNMAARDYLEASRYLNGFLLESP